MESVCSPNVQLLKLCVQCSHNQLVRPRHNDCHCKSSETMGLQPSAAGGEGLGQNFSFKAKEWQKSKHSFPKKTKK